MITTIFQASHSYPVLSTCNKIRFSRFELGCVTFHNLLFILVILAFLLQPSSFHLQGTWYFLLWFSGRRPLHIILNRLQCFREQICFHPQVKQWRGIYWIISIENSWSRSQDCVRQSHLLGWFKVNLDLIFPKSCQHQSSKTLSLLDGWNIAHTSWHMTMPSASVQ